jgi:hypothetical protein
MPSISLVWSVYSVHTQPVCGLRALNESHPFSDLCAQNEIGGFLGRAKLRVTVHGLGPLDALTPGINRQTDYSKIQD